jgi:hypothetical protein
VAIPQQESAMDPTIDPGNRKYFTKLDYAALRDIGVAAFVGFVGHVGGSRAPLRGDLATVAKDASKIAPNSVHAFVAR